MSNGKNGTRYRTTIIGAVVAVVTLGVAAIVALSIAGVESRTTPAIATILGFVAPTVVALLALLKSEKVEQHATDIERATNGHGERLAHIERVVDEAGAR